jgi:hypothetical protein
MPYSRTDSWIMAQIHLNWVHWFKVSFSSVYHVPSLFSMHSASLHPWEEASVGVSVDQIPLLYMYRPFPSCSSWATMREILLCATGCALYKLLDWHHMPSMKYYGRLFHIVTYTYVQYKNSIFCTVGSVHPPRWLQRIHDATCHGWPESWRGGRHRYCGVQFNSHRSRWTDIQNNVEVPCA